MLDITLSNFKSFFLFLALDDLSSDDFDHVHCCVYSKDIELTYDQTRFFLQRLFGDTFIRCRPFVHVLTPTNTKDCVMVGYNCPC